MFKNLIVREYQNKQSLQPFSKSTIDVVSDAEDDVDKHSVMLQVEGEPNFLKTIHVDKFDAVTEPKITATCSYCKKETNLQRKETKNLMCCSVVEQPTENRKLQS